MAEIFLSDIGLIAVKIEATEGTAETPVAADAFLAEEIKYKPVINMHPRNPVRQDLSPDADVPGGRSATISFKTDLKGSGTAGTAPEYGELFKGCKHAETIVASTSVTYDPISSGDSSLTIVVYINVDGSSGKKYVFNGCRGTWKIGLVNGEPMYIEWEFTAADWSESDSAPLSGMSYDSAQPLVYQSATVTLDSQSFETSKLDIDAGNIVTITAPKVQYVDATPGERNEIRTQDTNLKFCRDSGNDHLKIKFT